MALQKDERCWEGKFFWGEVGLFLPLPLFAGEKMGRTGYGARENVGWQLARRFTMKRFDG